MIFTYVLSGNDEILPSTRAPASSRNLAPAVRTESRSTGATAWDGTFIKLLKLTGPAERNPP
jgi:hypothetical protein